ncbi:PaaI family thioesterase [Paraburkholderia gardini]|uniref:Thioesterase domain-containing protein n=1 Tax=Paraburkholderia gardini TaxID=2823469 RepID=A0ABN7QHL8_9BURK|nr:PaaI family thioesterase [Paraburkholderia gardini]CAG4887591.1 hypothetical protein R54767_00362 [Paraburkholderia gardini]
MTKASKPGSEAPAHATPVIESPFVDHLGAKLVSAVDGVSEVVLPLQPQLLNTWDVAHGGVTVEMKVNFMQPGRGELRATGRVLHRSTTMAYCEGEIRDTEGHFVAKALGTFKYMRRLAVGRDVKQQRMRSDPTATPGPSDG